MITALGVGVGTLNCYLLTAFPLWERIWSIITRPLFLMSGVFFHEMMPAKGADVSLVQPVLHCVGMLRHGIHPTYEAKSIQPGLAYSVFLAVLLFSALLARNHRETAGKPKQQVAGRPDRSDTDPEVRPTVAVQIDFQHAPSGGSTTWPPPRRELSPADIGQVQAGHVDDVLAAAIIQDGVTAIEIDAGRKDEPVSPALRSACLPRHRHSADRPLASVKPVIADAPISWSLP